MKTRKILSILLVMFLSTNFMLAQNITSYYKVGTVAGSIKDVDAKVRKALKEKGFTIYGSYYPQGKYSNKVIAFTRKDLFGAALAGKTQRVMASMLKVGYIKKGDKVEVNLLNPDYIFNAYFQGKYSTYKTKLDKVTSDVKSALKTIASDFTPFGGSLSAKKLKKYQYMMSMPEFTDPITLKTFSSFEAGVKKIEANLAAKKGGAVKVYRLKFNSSKVALYGVGLLNKTKGEAKFLPKIGTRHIAAMPYEILLLDKKAIILHGKYRLALHWPKLTMGQFMKIVSTPGNIEDMLKALTE